MNILPTTFEWDGIAETLGKGVSIPIKLPYFEIDPTKERCDAAYHDRHRVCPACGADDVRTTCFGYVYAPDRNRATCGCGWKGIVDDMVALVGRANEMMASALIARLASLIAVHGDLPIATTDSENGYVPVMADTKIDAEDISYVGDKPTHFAIQ